MYFMLTIIFVTLFRQATTVADKTCFCNDHKEKIPGTVFKCSKHNTCQTTGQCYTYAHPDTTLIKGCIIFTKCFDLNKPPVNGKMIDCCDSDMCNKNKTRQDLRVFVLRPEEYLNNTNDEEIVIQPKRESKIPAKVATAIAVPLSVIFICGTLITLYRSRRRKLLMKNNEETNKLMVDNCGNYIGDINIADLTTSGSGAGLPLLIQRTIARQILLHECIGAGRFGAVHRGTWRGQDVAVKIFSTDEEASWFREAQIYQTTMLRHENVLGFIAADNKDTGSCTQLWLVTEYQPLGSVYDFLQENTVTIQEMVKMVFSIVNGLAHLHMEVIGTQGKPAMAHRDIKTKNILVKNDKTCSIADLGLTVLHTSMNDKVDMPNSSRPGTRRYQAPEILEDIINLRHFDAYRRADVYALSLCIWEICRRTVIQGQVKEYQLPYFDSVNPDPSHEEMKQVVCDEKIRPAFPKYWHEDETMKGFLKVMKECWYHNSSARLTSLRVKKNILSMCKEMDIKL